ncbi:MAG: hypothetical protein ACJAVR_003773 [Paracoccaceae bacterium]
MVTPVAGGSMKARARPTHHRTEVTRNIGNRAKGHAFGAVPPFAFVAQRLEPAFDRCDHQNPIIG